MAHPDFLVVASLARDYLSHVGQEGAGCKSPPSKAAEVLRRVGASLQGEVEGHLRPYLDSLEVRSVDEAGRVFRRVMEEEFADGATNWGRVVTIFVFGGILAKELRGHGVPLGEKDLERVSQFMTDYIVQTKASWIRENGGWDGGFVAQFEEKSPWLLPWHSVKAKLVSVFFFSQYY